MFFEKALREKLECWVASIRENNNLPIRLRLWQGEQYDLGTFKTPKVVLALRSAQALPLFLSPNLGNLAEAYVSGALDIDGNINDTIAAGYELAQSVPENTSFLAWVMEHLSEHFTQHTRESDKASVQYHYDVSNAFYQRWLDRNLVYSCGYFENGDEDIDAAQIKKMDMILRKIRLQPGQRLLDIGCGWGALVLRAAQQYGARCVGVTLSQNQYDLAKERVDAAGLSGQVDIRLQDYRDVEGMFDRVTSIGMFEHVGKANLAQYFTCIHDLLTEDGIALNHGITSVSADSTDTPLGGGKFIERYVFPHGELPHISLTLRTMQEGGLEAFDVESWRRHYVRTLHLWSERFEAQGDALRDMVGEKFYRIWRVYLPGCAQAFELGNLSVFQILCQRANRSAQSLPWSRQYMYRDR